MSIPFEFTSLHIAAEFGLVYLAWRSLQLELGHSRHKENFQGCEADEARECLSEPEG
jgi:hypothetical protein